MSIERTSVCTSSFTSCDMTINTRGSRLVGNLQEDSEMNEGIGLVGGRSANVKLINQCPVWKEAFEEQRRHSFCDVQLFGMDGYVPAHLIYLKHVSGLVDRHSNLLPNAVPFSTENVLALTLTDVRVDDIRTVLSFVYSGVAVVNKPNWPKVLDVIRQLEIPENVLKIEPVPKKGPVPRHFKQVLLFRQTAAEPTTNMERGRTVDLRAVVVPFSGTIPLLPPSSLHSTGEFDLRNLTGRCSSAVAISGNDIHDPEKKSTATKVSTKPGKKEEASQRSREILLGIVLQKFREDELIRRYPKRVNRFDASKIDKRAKK